MVGENYNSPQIFMTIIKVRGRSNLEGWNWRPGLFTFDGLGRWVRIAASLDFTFLLQHRQFGPSVSAIFVRRKIDKEIFVSELFSVPYIWYQYLHMFWALLISQINNNSQTIKKGMNMWDWRGSSPLANFPKRSPISSCDGTAGDSGTQLNSSKKQIRSTVLCASAMVLHIGAWYCDCDSGRQLNRRKKLIRNLNLLRSSLQFQRDSLMISQRPLCMEFVFVHLQ